MAYPLKPRPSASFFVGKLQFFTDGVDKEFPGGNFFVAAIDFHPFIQRLGNRDTDDIVIRFFGLFVHTFTYPSIHHLSILPKVSFGDPTSGVDNTS